MARSNCCTSSQRLRPTGDAGRGQRILSRTDKGSLIIDHCLREADAEWNECFGAAARCLQEREITQATQWIHLNQLEKKAAKAVRITIKFGVGQCTHLACGTVIDSGAALVVSARFGANRQAFDRNGKHLASGLSEGLFVGEQWEFNASMCLPGADQLEWVLTEGIQRGIRVIQAEIHSRVVNFQLNSAKGGPRRRGQLAPDVQLKCMKSIVAVVYVAVIGHAGHALPDSCLSALPCIILLGVHMLISFGPNFYRIGHMMVLEKHPF
ncbi:hypothetical protein DFH09DRAFT_1110499 [Mycena vulgaris]|nr:hypothetical protein DFH09DRAFT_1110499 [Mycena vulgaris]